MKKICFKLLREERGGMLTMTAVIIPVMMGFLGIGIDASSWFLERRGSQILTDMASVEAAHQARILSGQQLVSNISDFAAEFGFDSNIDSLQVTTPPSSGAFVGRNGFVEVTHTRQVPLYFLSLFSAFTGESFDVAVSTRSVSGSVVTGTQCFVALDENANRAIDVSGTADVDVNCGVASNSVSDEAIYVGGNATLSADPARAVGDIVTAGGGQIFTNYPLQPFSDPTPDPYENLPLPADNGCDHNGKTSIKKDTVLTPGRYCGELRLQNGNITLSPGTYIIEGDDLIVNSQANVSGTGVTIILTGDTASSIGSVNINGGAIVSLSAPDSGTYAGILVYQDRDIPYLSDEAIFNGGADLNLDGVLYFPSSALRFNGGSDLNPSCLMLYAATLKFNGNNDLANDSSVCTNLSLDEPSTQTVVQLVE